MTKFSIIITCYRQERFIREAVDSALALPGNNEIIVVDDASPDGSVQILEGYGDRIRLIKNEKNVGCNGARNAGASAAHGEFLVFLDGDDLFYPWALDVYARIIEVKNPKVLLCKLLFFEGEIPRPEFRDFGEAVEVAEYDSVIHKDRCYRGSGSAFVVDRATFLNAGGFASEIFPCEIEDLTAQLGFSVKTIHILSHPTIAYRIHEQNTVHQIVRFVDAMRAVIGKEKNGKYPGGSGRRLQRYSYLGGPAFYWFTRAWRDGLYRPALKLLGEAWPLMLVAICSRIALKVSGPRASQWIKMPAARPSLRWVPVSGGFARKAALRSEGSRDREQEPALSDFSDHEKISTR